MVCYMQDTILKKEHFPCFHVEFVSRIISNIEKQIGPIALEMSSALCVFMHGSGSHLSDGHFE